MSLKAVLAGSASLIALASGMTPAFAQNDQIETVVVTGIRASEERAIDIKRDSSTIVDAVSAEDIGKMPDKNVADALQRVPGVETFSSSSGEGGFDENNRVAIRGTDPSLTLTTIDGHSVATGDWFILDQFQTVGRSVSFDLLPSEMVSTVEVHKSQQADMVEGGSAGSVDIITRKPLDFSEPLTLEASAQAVYSDLADKTTPQFNGLLNWHNDSDTFGILVQGFYEKRDLERQGQEFLGYGQITAAAEPALVAEIPALNGVLYPTLIGEALFEQQRTREGGDVTMEWRPTKQLDVVVSSFYSNLSAGDTNNNYMAWFTNEIANNQNLPTSYTIKNGTLVQANFPKINDNPLAAGYGSVVNGLVEDSIDRPNEGASTWYVDGDVKWNPSSDWNIHAKLGYTKGVGSTPSQPTWESEGATGVDADFTNGGPAAVSYPGFDTGNPADMNADWSWSDRFTAIDTEFYTQADAEVEMNDGPLQSIKFGVRYDSHDRDVYGFDEGTCAFACPGTPSSAISNGQMYPSNFGSGFGGAPGFPIWAPNWSLVASEVMPQVTPYSPLAYYWPGSFQVQEKVWAGYAMANLGGNKWSGNVGVRLVDTNENSDVNSGNGAITSGCPTGETANNYGCYSTAVVQHTYIAPLPSANFKYDLSDDQVLRFAIDRTMSRPDYSALGGAVSLTDSILTGSGGNPNLRPVESWDFDAGWEWYFGKASLLSAHVFYMDLTTDVDYGVFNENFLNATLTGQTHAPVFSNYAITLPVNGNGTDKGLELAWEQPIWAGFGAQANATISDGEQGASTGGGRLIGDSKYLYNLIGYYEGYGFTARVAYTWRSSVLVGLDRSTAENQAAIGNLAASASYDITNNISLTFDALNLNNATLKYYANNTSQPRAFYDNGRQFYAGVRVKF